MATPALPLTSTNARMVEGMPFEEYAAVDALNGSSIVHMRRSPMYYRWAKDNPQPATPAMILGTATHRLILEPDRVGDFAVWGLEEDQKARRGKVWDAFRDAHAGRMIVTQAECESMVGMAVGARKLLPIRKYADAKGPSEVSLFWTDPVSRRAMKCRIDKWVPASRTVFDLKTTRSCQPYKFGAQAYQLGYHIKMAIQCAGIRNVLGVEPHLKIGAIESRAPYESAVYRITSDVILQGFEELDGLLKTLTECEKTNIWPAAMEDESDLLLPSWAITDPDADLSEFAVEEEG
jgi:hypothetical protein